jgi:hypothetical protein
MLTLAQVVHLGGLYLIDAQLIVSTRQKADPARHSQTFHRVLLAESTHKRRPSNVEAPRTTVPK